MIAFFQQSRQKHIDDINKRKPYFWDNKVHSEISLPRLWLPPTNDSKTWFVGVF